MQYESDTGTKPVANSELIRFNGIGGAGHETFVVYADGGDDFCKTAQKPYDRPVCEILLVLNALVPSFHISSDGFYGHVEDQKEGVKLDGEWDGAIRDVEGYGVFCHAEITGTHGGRDGNPDPYCSMSIVVDRTEVPASV